MILRSDVHWKMKNNIGYLKMGESVFSLNGLNVEDQERYWDILIDENISTEQIVEFRKKEDGFDQFVDFLERIGAFISGDVWETFGKEVGLQLKEYTNVAETFRITVVGDKELVDYSTEILKETYPNIQSRLEDAQLGIMITHKYSHQNRLKLNKILHDAKIPFIVVTVEPFNTWIGPFVLPDETACINCLSKRERENKIYAEEHNLFEDVEPRNSNQIPMTFVKTALEITNTQISKYIMHTLGNYVMLGLVNTAIEYQWINDKVINHKIIRHPGCDICYPSHKMTHTEIWTEKI
ncbi:TOMM precursor leader peptide-binding protein (plasmid) [Bacillus thuringiensis]|nr:MULTISPECIES: TOMM precursor leader peptide-binding protein [Bacillus cereus group]QKH22490.1 TOMM precursor leader peptide-binding protein [Bacillus thuringiensis]